MENFIISFDGGGIRALASIQVLKKISVLLDKKGIEDLKVDLVSGTSAGAIIALTLSRKEFTLNENIEALEQAFNNFESIFIKNKENVKPIYLNFGLKKLGDDLFQDRKLSDSKFPVSVFAYDIVTSKPIVLSSDSFPDISMSEAMQSSCCAPGFFSPIKIPKNHFALVDGGVYANNPVIYTYLKAKQLFPMNYITNILSISTMWQPRLFDNDENMADESKLLSNGQMRTTDLLANSLADLNYCRIHKFNSEEQIKMDKTDIETKRKLIEYGKLLAEENSEKIDSFINRMVLRQAL